MMFARIGAAWDRLKRKWGVSDFGVVAILLSFSLAGMACLRVSRPIMHVILPAGAPKWLWWTTRVVVIPPVYEVLLFAFGTLLGQHRFFWPKQKRLLRFIARPFISRA
jgi:hypothetical protein